MGKKGRTKKGSTLSVLNELIDLADGAMERFTGKSIAGWLQDLQQQGAAQIGEQSYTQTSTQQALNDPYFVLGLPSDATIDQVKARYRQLASIFHPDKEGGYVEAMKKVNAAYQEILKDRGVKA